MFASEKVMLEYFDQLLNDAEPNPKETTTTQVGANQTQEPLAPVTEPSVSVTERLGDSYFAAKAALTERARIARQNREISQKTQAKPAPTLPDVKPYKEPELASPEPDTNSIAKLLQQVNVKQEAKIAKERQKTVDLVRSVTQDVAQPEVQTKVESVVEQKVDVKSEVQPEIEAEAPVAVEAAERFPDEPFQALFFSVAGLSLAVPLQELGGIHKLTELSSLFGKPSWFKGVMLSRGKKLNVVDSARWVMPEKYNKNMEEGLNYQYLIMLGESNWGLAAESLVETESISPDAVKWRKNAHKRPWLMGTIKEKMCALLHVSDLIAMLEKGIDARQE